MAAARGAQTVIPGGLVAAIHAGLGAGTIRSSSAARAAAEPPDFGYAVALSADGTTALVGAPGADNGKGAVYIFHVSDAGSWSSSGTPTAVLRNKTGAAKDQFVGEVVALSADGTTAFAGAPGIDDGSGAIYAFHASAEDAWTSTSTPTATLSVSNDFLVGLASVAVSPDGTTLLVGAPFFNDISGGAYVFHAASEGAWASTSTPTAVLSNAGESLDDEGVGFAVAISGDGTTALLSDTGNAGGGGAYVYHVAAEDAWASSTTPTAILSDSNSFPDDGLGAAVALSGDGTVAFLGAPGANSFTGAVDVFRASGEATWASSSAPTATLTKVGGAEDDFFGGSVAASDDGTTAIVTAAGVKAGHGAAYVFRVADEGSWATSAVPTAILTHSSGRNDDSLGVGVALSADGATTLLGAPGVRFETGAADVFHAADATSWASSSAPNAILTNSALNACVVPKLKGLTVRGAKSALKARSCRLGKIRRVHSKAKKGRVIFQSRKVGTRPAVGTKVNVKVAK